MRPLEDYPWEDFDAIQKEVEQIHADAAQAYQAIRDAKARYIKAKTKARSKAEAQDAERLYAALADYETRDQIQDAWGWDYITEKERDRLMGLWDARERAKNTGTAYTDRVTEMLDRAARNLLEPYGDKLRLAEEMTRAGERVLRERVEADREARHAAWIAGL